MLESAFWGLIQGLTEFLPVSSSGHLVLVPAIFGREGPDLATSAVLHLGTLAAVLVYFRQDIIRVLSFDAAGRRLLRWLVIGTIPAVVLGLLFRSTLEEINDSPRWVATALFFTGIALVLTRFIPSGKRTVEQSSNVDPVALGFGQALALIPGVSRSGTTIGAGLSRSFDRVQAARYSFLLGIPTIAGAGLLQFFEMADQGGKITADVWLGMGVAAVSGYAAIEILLRLLAKVGLAPFGAYCIVAGAVAFVLV